ncbi:hypothetical protein B0J18DRAFT_37365 [Chaetomium sp. MPI-SDFR-AT-0129]|nr:hypothetical protein B0J18DRAFT_37365 [Chaetomium sp. MPI-SDFR-AT-0129]
MGSTGSRQIGLACPAFLFLGLFLLGQSGWIWARLGLLNRGNMASAEEARAVSPTVRLLSSSLLGLVLGGLIMDSHKLNWGSFARSLFGQLGWHDFCLDMPKGLLKRLAGRGMPLPSVF